MSGELTAVLAAIYVVAVVGAIVGTAVVLAALIRDNRRPVRHDWCLCIDHEWQEDGQGGRACRRCDRVEAVATPRGKG